MRQPDQYADHVDGGMVYEHLAAPTLRLVAELPEHTTSRYERYVKPAVDFIGATLLCVLLSPLLVVITVAVYLNLGTPVLIRQERVGRGGVVFTMYKFRSMDHDRRRQHHSRWQGPERRISHKRPDDPRLVPLGRFLRKWSLDELPQLLNIIRGEMSFVGPRPEMVSIVERYEPWQHARHMVKPGLTGWWQVTSRNLGPMHEHTVEDLRYLGRVSMWTDLRLLTLTVPAMLGKMRGQ